MAEAPHRRFSLSVSIEADEWEDILRRLDELMTRVHECQPPWHSVSGGPSESHIIEAVERPNVTHDSYFRELQNYLTALRHGVVESCERVRGGA